jgi:signal transduction histidine kinase
MLSFRDLSFRYKIPLRGIGLVLVTTTLLTLTLVLRERQELHRDIIDGARVLGAALVQNLAEPLRHDDVWRAFELIRAPLQTAGAQATESRPVALVVFDAAGGVYVSTDPDRFTMSMPPEEIPAIRPGAAFIRHPPPDPAIVVDRADDDFILLVSPIRADGIHLGALVMAYSKAAFTARIARLVEQAAIVTGLILAVLVPVTWYWGARMAKPLVDLAENMGKVSSPIPPDTAFASLGSGDELGRADTAFRAMVAQLREKEALENEIIFAERLAAIGRLTAGVAHEINNPLGAMLNAIDTHQLHGGDPAFTAKTLSLLQRGLLQIRDTVSALLVEARPHGRALGAQDVEDVRTLTQANLDGKAVRLDWHNGLPRNVEIALPATLIRQVLLNLLLNACQAVHEGGRIEVVAEAEADRLKLQVANDGDFIEADRLGYLFEPFVSYRDQGHGLGLWVTYQIVDHLGGEIAVRSSEQETRFTVILPIPHEEAA